jgi:hypothetical protein
MREVLFQIFKCFLSLSAHMTSRLQHVEQILFRFGAASSCPSGFLILTFGSRPPSTPDNSTQGPHPSTWPWPSPIKGHGGSSRSRMGADKTKGLRSLKGGLEGRGCHWRIWPWVRCGFLPSPSF